MSRRDRTDLSRALGGLPLRVLLAVVVAAVTYALGAPPRATAMAALTLAVLVGGVVLVVLFLIDVENRLARGLTKINEATDLFGLVEASALRTDAMQLVRHSTQINPKAPPIVVRFAQHEISRMSDFLKELSRGSNVTYEGEDRDWMLGLARTAETSIDATSLTTVDAGGQGFVDGGLWASDLGQRYLEVQRDAVVRGVTVRRVFILNRKEFADDPGFRHVCQLQQEMGINVRVLDSSTVPGVQRSSMFDFVLFDEAVSYEVTPGSPMEDTDRPNIVNTRLELRPSRVRDRALRFRDLWASAREYA